MNETKSEGLRQLLDLMPVLVAFVDCEGRLGWANRTFCSLFPQAGAGGEGDALKIAALFHGIGDELPSLIRDVLETGSAISGIIEPVDVPAGGIRTLKLDILPCTGTTDGGKWVIIFAIDVTEQAGMERLKKEAYEQIEKNIEQFATLGDHIRNPVAVITGLCDLLNDTATGGKILTQAKEIDRIVDQIDHGWIDSEKVRSMLKKYYDVGVSGTHELVARAIHEEFLSHLKMSGQSPENNPSMLPWDDLPRSLQESNLMQADDIWRKLGEIHCAIGIATESRIQPIAFTPDEVELLAMYEHERWMSERIRRGWTYSPEINISERTHNCLVPWQQLPEYQREKDRNTIRTLPQVLAKVRLKIVRLHV